MNTNLQSLAADLASCVPAMALDTPCSNAKFIENFLRRAIAATSEDELVSQQQCEIARLEKELELMKKNLQNCLALEREVE